MIRNLLATTAIATLVATGAAMAQTTTPPATTAPTQAAPQVKHAEGHLASNLIGETVYNGTGEDAENIGEVNDLVLNNEGQVQAIVVGVGGFLGIGEKNVALEYNLVEWAEMDGDEYMVVETTREALEAQEEFDVAAFEPQPADAQVGNTKPATADDLAAAPAAGAEGGEAATDDMAAAPADDGAATDDMAAAPADDSAAAPAEEETAAAPAEEAPADDMAATEEEAPADDMAAAPADDGAAATTEEDTAAAPAEEAPADDMAAAPADDGAATEEDTAAAPAEDGAATDETQTAAIDRSTLSEVQTGDISAEEFVGTTVYGANDETIGEIGDVILSEDGNVEAVIVDVGGFLGVGEKQVAVSMENLAFLSDEDGSMYLYTQFTQEQLDAQPAYDESTYAENSQDQLLVAPAE